MAFFNFNQQAFLISFQSPRDLVGFRSAMQISSVSHGVSRFMSQSSFYYLGQHIDLCNELLPLIEKEFPLFLSLSPWLKEGERAK